MVRTQKRLTSILALCLLAVTLTAAKCSDDKLAAAAKASDDLAAAINSAIVLKRQLAAEGKITNAEDLKITQALYVVNEAATLYYQEVKTITTFDATAKSRLAGSFARVTASLKDINDQHIFEPKSAESQNKLKAVLTAMGAAAVAIESLLR